MSKTKKVWSELEDQMLKKYYEQENMRNWSQIAKRLTEENNTPKKSGKQCRERYENHIDASLVRIEWTKEEEEYLIELHDQLGNKWASIASYMPGKSDNCVKNHFYSKLRKILRKLNRVIHLYFRREFREINITIIYKLVEATEERLKPVPNCSMETSLQCQEIQNKLLRMASENFCDEDEEAGTGESEQHLKLFRKTIREINCASKEYKRKSKKSRNQSIQAPNLKKKKEKRTLKNIVVQEYDRSAYSDGYLSDRSGDASESQHSHINQKGSLGPKFILDDQDHKPTEDAEKEKQPNQVEVNVGKEAIQNMLRSNNILQSDAFSSNNMYQFGGNSGIKFSENSSFKSVSEKDDRDSDFGFCNFFDSSDAQMGGSRLRKKNEPLIHFIQKMDDNKSICFSEKQ